MRHHQKILNTIFDFCIKKMKINNDKGSFLDKGNKNVGNLLNTTTNEVSALFIQIKQLIILHIKRETLKTWNYCTETIINRIFDRINAQKSTFFQSSK